MVIHLLISVPLLPFLLQEDRENVLRARESGKGVLTAPFKLLNNRLGVISTYTVYKTELPPNASPQERIQAAIG
jgi:histidine kinase 2/3/4 (cytokinin receptor)